MRPISPLFLLLLAAGALAGPAAAQTPAGPTLRFEALDPPSTGNCISPVEEAMVAADLRAAEAAFGPLDSQVPPGPRAASGYLHYPMAGNIDGTDLWINNYLDLDPSAAIEDWDCTDHSYDGHQGSDTIIRTFGYQTAGVPIFAIDDGLVVGVHDGEFDRNTAWTAGAVANYVIINHGGGRVGYYWHMKKHSVAVVFGQTVKAGEFLGMTGSSGYSDYPHLHLELRDSGTAIEPWSGLCGPALSQWAAQEPIDRTARVLDHAAANTLVTPTGSVPYEKPRGGVIAHSDAEFGWWMLGSMFPANASCRIRVLRPDGSIEWDSNPISFGNTVPYRMWWLYLEDSLAGFPGMQTIAGTWQVELQVNGAVLSSTPFEVMASVPAGFNRAPEPIEAELDPPAPLDGDVIACRVRAADIPDADYEIPRFRYVWRVDGQVVRDVEHAGLADQLPAGTAASGQTVQCAVAVGDAAGFLPPEVVGAVVDGGMTLLAPESGVAGQANLFRLGGVTPGGIAWVAGGAQLGATAVPGCAGLASPLSGPPVVFPVQANGNGVAQFQRLVPGQYAGVTLHVQAFDLQACRASNLLSYAFR